MKQQYPYLHKEICLTCKIHKQQDKGGYGGVILKWGQHTSFKTGFGKHKHKTLLLRTKPAFYQIHGKKNEVVNEKYKNKGHFIR